MEAKSRVERRYDDKRQVQVVQSDFAPKPGVSMQFVGAPKVQLGDILFNLEMSRYDGQRPCDKLELLINDVPLAATNASSSPVGARVRFSAHFEFQQFKPLAQRFPSFGVRRCDFQLKLSEADVRLLQKFLLMYSDMAVEVQSAQEGTPAASPPPEGAISL
jgi:hypothetical protein